MTGEHADPSEGPDTAAAPYRPGYELVAEQLLTYIAEQNLMPGDRLPTEQGLAQILGATRNVTREAIKVLAAIGRLTVRRGAGIFVAATPGALNDDRLAHFQPTRMEHVMMLIDYRQLIESDTAQKAAGLATPLEVRAIGKSAEASLGAALAGDVAAFAAADEQFHDAVGIAAHNVFLRSSITTIRRLMSQTDILLFHGDVPGSLEVAGRQHLAIAAAISSGGAEKAAELMQEHIDTTRRQVERKIRDRLFNLTEPVGGAAARKPRGAQDGGPDGRQEDSPETSAS
ncbi:transcriptional regulator, GntR family [Streptomyces sp. DvalAA-14]|uniref:FadR/GntR family transcriptional regulator n=1 Tax=unclassified Streptomyces TaxID=2593676 RepID=UPI00081B1C71|nr:FCD domain-containing protein [Streptomyces sp. DvalAA-14]SCE38957.1 transcriptional regulator, GntR family [Streptomyces sp. DvalAA-14]